MKSIVLLICSVIATTLFAQPTTLDMKERYYMKGEKSEISLKGGANLYNATVDKDGNYFYVGAAITQGEGRKAIFGKLTVATSRDESYSYSDYTMYDCFMLDEKLLAVANNKLSVVPIDATNNSKTYGAPSSIGYQRVIAVGDYIIVFGVDKKSSALMPFVMVYENNTIEQLGGMAIDGAEGYYPVNDYTKIKNDMVATNNVYSLWGYVTQNSFSDVNSALIGVAGFNSDKQTGYIDKIDVKNLLTNFVSDFRPYTSYENKAYEQVNKVQWAISGIHPKEDGTFLITASFIHWTTTASGKAGYQKGILGVEYDATKSNSITDTWVVFPWAVKEASNMQEKLEINPYYTHYIGGNDIAVFDQETGHLFAINSDLDACKSSDELGTCGAKSKELQKWLINNRLIARMEGYDYFLNFVGSNTAHQEGERKSIHLICSQNGGSQLQTVNLDLK